MSHAAYEYVAGAAGAGLTDAENRAAFQRILLRQRVLVDASHIDTKLRLFDRDYPYPILLGPTGYHKLVHAEGELETVKGANLSDATLVAACFSTVAFEAMSREATRPLWFQLYIQTDRGFTKELVDRVLEAGCEAVCVTVDVPVNGPRDREYRAGFSFAAGCPESKSCEPRRRVFDGGPSPGRAQYLFGHTWRRCDLERYRLAAVDYSRAFAIEGNSRIRMMPKRRSNSAATG